MSMSAKRSAQTKFTRSIATGITLVDFNASWCQPCRKQAAVIKALTKEIPKAVRIRMLNIDRFPDVALRLGIQSIPTILIYKDGKEIHRFIGLQSRRVLENALKKMLPAFPAGDQTTTRQGERKHGKMH